MNRTDFQEMADVRIAEAAALLTLPVPMADGAYYLAGYAIECALKACIAKTVNQYDWPEKWVDPFQVKVTGVDDPVARAVMDIQQRFPGGLATRLRSCRLGDVFADEVYIYPLPIAVAVP